MEVSIKIKKLKIIYNSGGKNFLVEYRIICPLSYIHKSEIYITYIMSIYT